MLCFPILLQVSPNSSLSDTQKYFVWVMILMIFSHSMMSRMSFSSSHVLVFLLCLSHECNGRHFRSIDDHAMDDKPKLLSHSSLKGCWNEPFTVKDQTDTIDVDHHKQTDFGSKNKKDMIKDQKVKKVKEEVVHGHHHENHHKTVTFRVPPKNKRVHQQPRFNLDYSPPKTHPPSHN